MLESIVLFLVLSVVCEFLGINALLRAFGMFVAYMLFEPKNVKKD
jgi:hypothetical protein